MKRTLMLIAGPVSAGLFAVLMYSVYGNLNWGSAAERNLPWFEPAFQVLFVSGALLVGLFDILSFLAKKVCAWRQRVSTSAKFPCPREPGKL